MKKAEQRSNLHRISLRMKYPGEGKNLEDLQLRKSVFPTNHTNALIRNSVSDQGPNATVDCGVSSSRSRRGSDGPVDAKVSKSPFTQDPDENVMIADEERVFMILSRCQGYWSGHVTETY
jgi:hypothetical protein